MDKQKTINNMKNKSLEKECFDAKYSVIKVVSDLISEIEKLEELIDGKDKLIEQLQDEVRDLSNQVEEYAQGK